MFGLSHTTASKYTLIACGLLADQPGQNAGGQHDQAPAMSTNS